MVNNTGTALIIPFFHIYNFFDDYLEDIMKEEVLPYEDIEGKIIFETIDNIKKKYFLLSKGCNHFFLIKFGVIEIITHIAVNMVK